MSAKFLPKRVSGVDLAAQLAPATAGMPAAVPAPAPVPQAGLEAAPQPGQATAKAAATVQINFKASLAFADLIAQEGAKAGSTRRFLARLLCDAGYDVPKADLNPADRRRRRGEAVR